MASVRRFARVLGFCALLLALAPAVARADVDLYEPDDTAAQAKPIVPGETQVHGTDGSWDYVYFYGIAGHSYIFDVARSGALQYLWDTCWIEDAAGNTLVYDSWGQFVFRPTQSGVYYIRMGVYSISDFPSYSITMRDLPHTFVRGTARDLATDMPLEGVEVSVIQDQTFAAVFNTVTMSALTSSDGTYEIELPWPGACIVRFSDPGGRYEGEYYGGVVWEDLAQHFDAPWSGGVLAGIDGRLGLPWTLDARLVDAVTGEPIPGVMLGARTNRTGTLDIGDLEPRESDGSGRVQLTFPARTYAYPSVSDPLGRYPRQSLQSTPSVLAGLHGTPGETMTVDIPVQRSGSMVLVVRDRRTGRPFPGVRVELFCEETIRPPYWNTDWTNWPSVTSRSADSSGGVCFTDLPPGSYRVLVRGTGDGRIDGWIGAQQSASAADGLAFSVSSDATASYDAFLMDLGAKMQPVMKFDAVPGSAPSMGLTIGGRVSWNGAATYGDTVRLETSKTGLSWSDSGMRAKTDATGRFQFTVRPASKTYYRAVLPEGWWNSAGSTAKVCVRPQATLGPPVAPSSARTYRSVSVYGSLSPRHRNHSRPVRVYLWRRVGGVWKAAGYVLATAHDREGITRYVTTVRFTRRGTWRLRAYHADDGHAPTWSKHYDYVTVR